ncbi:MULTISPECIES: type II toxin-antitoxin system PemK/MazF family toxin [Chloracidobacterium]|uniref:type II toxin-antitoxin system PemK/MazF family toxin n=1 Tax=Chloracidobacterium TaxID=458032 RepID=UPI0011D2A850
MSATAFNRASGCLVLAMITSAQNPPWPFDCPISDLTSAGLPTPSSVVCAKLFTLDVRLVRGVLGYLAEADCSQLGQFLYPECWTLPHDIHQNPEKTHRSRATTG